VAGVEFISGLLPRFRCHKRRPTPAPLVVEERDPSLFRPSLENLRNDAYDIHYLTVYLGGRHAGRKVGKQPRYTAASVRG
jgi:hypothetical protein